MKDLGNYECDGQMDLFDIYLKSCCGVVPWLHKAKCCRWNEEKPQEYMTYYMCPKCCKRPVDSDGWPIRSKGTLEDAREKSKIIWNDPATTFAVDEWSKAHGVHVSLWEREEWAKTYNVDEEELVGCLLRLD